MSSRRYGRAGVPVTLPRVEVEIDPEGGAAITINGKQHDRSDALNRNTLAKEVERIAALLGPVRVQIAERDGTTFTDVVVPDPPVKGSTQRTDAIPASEIVRNGFTPGETVVVAVVIAHRLADGSGEVQLRVPPIVAARANVVLLGRASGAFAVSRRS